MKHVLFTLLLCLPLQLFAQQVEIEGTLLGAGKEPLSAATVRCYQDTTFVKGTTTDGKGKFELKQLPSGVKYQLKFNYLGYKETSLTLHPTQEKRIRLGDIVLSDEARQMQEVTVVAEDRIQTEEKLMVFPAKELIRHAYDGFSALDVLMIPGLDVSGSSVSYMLRPVMLCINGQEATSEEVQNLFPKDIKRIDVYQQGTPDYPDADVLVDFVLKERDYAGTASFYRAQELTKWWGEGRLSAQYFEGQSEFALSVSDNYNNFTLHPEGNTQTSYQFPTETVTRTEQELSAMDKKNGLNMYANYIYRDKKQYFYASLRFNRKASEEEAWDSQQYTNEAQPLVKQEYKHSQSINPALQLRYNIQLPRHQRLRAELYGSHGNNDYRRWYERRRGETLASDYRNGTEEESWYGKARISYSKAFQNGSSLNLEVTEDFTHTEDLNRREENLSEVSLNKSNTRIYAIYNYKIQKKLNAQLRLAEHLSYTNTGKNHVFNSFFVPSLKLTFRPNNAHSLTMEGSVKSVEASNANRTGDEYQRNEYEMFVGNPYLEDYTQWQLTQHYNWMVNSRWSVFAYNGFNLTTKQAYDNYYYDAGRGMFVYQQLNGGRCWGWHHEIGAQFDLLPRKFYIRALFLYNHTQLKLWRKFVHNGPYGSCNFTFLHKGWRFWIGCIFKSQTMDETSGEIVHHPITFDFNTSYSIHNWNFSLAATNLFVKAHTDGLLLRDGYVHSYSSRTSRLTDNIINLHVSYRFTFGKKKHKFDNTEVEDVNQTTISK